MSYNLNFYPNDINNFNNTNGFDNNYNPYTDNIPVKEEEESSGGFFFGFDGPIIGPDGKPLPPLERKEGETLK